MKILHISYSDFVGGASRATLRIHKSLLNSKIDSTLLVFKKSKKKNRKVFKIQTNKYLQLSKIIFNKFVNKLYPGKTSILSLNIFGSGIVDFINNSNFDIIHLHWINNEILSIKEISKIKSKMVWTCHDMWPCGGIYHYFFPRDFNKNIIDKFIYNYKRKKLYNKNIYYVGVSKWIKKSVKNYLKQKKLNSFKVNNPINEKFWKPINTKKQNQKCFNIGVGNIDEGNYNRKGKDIFIDLIKNLKKKNKINFRIIEFGNKNLDFIPQNLENLRYGIVKDSKKIREIYNIMDILILPSKLEAFGQIASEAILCGTPVIGFNKTGLDDIIIHKKNGWLANKFKVNQLIKGIEFFYFKKKNKKLIRKSILGKFSEKKIAKEYINIYKQRINEKN